MTRLSVGCLFFHRSFSVFCEHPESVVQCLTLIWGGIFSNYCFENCFLSFLSFPSGISITHVLHLLQLSHSSWMVCSSVFSLFSICFSELTVSVSLPSSVSLSSTSVFLQNCFFILPQNFHVVGKVVCLIIKGTSTRGEFLPVLNRDGPSAGVIRIACVGRQPRRWKAGQADRQTGGARTRTATRSSCARPDNHASPSLLIYIVTNRSLCIFSCIIHCIIDSIHGWAQIGLQL